MSVMEISHRSGAFDELADSTEACLRRLLSISDDYAVLFLAGGATMQFAQIPLNLASPDRPGVYIVDGSWSKKAFSIAQRMGLARLAGLHRSAPLARHGMARPGPWIGMNHLTSSA